MVIDIRALGFSLTDAIRMHVESRLNAAIKPFARQVVTITARLEDINADRGGANKRYTLVATLRRRGAVVTEAFRGDLYVAVDAAAVRLRRSVQRLLTRHAARERSDRQRPDALVTP